MSGRQLKRYIVSLALVLTLILQMVGPGAILVSAENANEQPALPDSNAGTEELPVYSETDMPVSPEAVGTAIKEIVQAAAELAEADPSASEVEQLSMYIEETHEQLEMLPEEGQEILRESAEALDHAGAAVDIYQDACRQIEETGTIETDPAAKENSFRYLNGVPIDETLITVDEEIEAAAEMDLQELFGSDDGTDFAQESKTDPSRAVPGDDGRAGREPASGQDDTDIRGADAGEIPGQNAGQDMKDPTDPETSTFVAAGQQDADLDESNRERTGGTDRPDADKADGTDEPGADKADGTENPGADKADGTGKNLTDKTDTEQAGGVIEPGTEDADRTTPRKSLPEANVALVRSVAGDTLVDLTDAAGTAAPEAVATGGKEVHKGIDVSHHNGSIDWDAVKKAGIEFVIIRCGHGRNLETGGDNYWLRNIREVERVGLPYGIYFYSYATTVAGAKAEAATTVRLLKGHKPTLPVFFDMEDYSQKVLPKSLINNIAIAYCDAIADAGYQPGFYSYKYWLEELMGSFLDKTDYPVWVAQYGSKTTYAGDYVAWQYTSGGSVDGIYRRVDMNYWYGAMSMGAPQVASTLRARNKVQESTKWAVQTTADTYKQEQITVTINGKKTKKWIIYEIATGKRLKDKFVYLPSLDKICYFDKNGYKVFGEKKINGKWYLFDDESGDSGKLLTGFRYIAGKDKICYYDAKGRRASGKKKIGKYWYYFSPKSGKMKRNGFLTIKKKKCYYNSYGRAVSGEKKIKGSWYYFSPDSYAMKKGFQKVAGTKKTCYYNAKGKRVSGLKRIKGRWYYFKPSTGAMKTGGFQTVNHKKYYFDAKGRMLLGTHQIKGKWYTFTL